MPGGDARLVRRGVGDVADGTSGTPDMAGAIGGPVGGEDGLDGLVGQLINAGFGDVVSSWVGTGANKPVDPGQLADALGPDTLNQLAPKAGLDVGVLLPMLAAALPSIIDALTPDGKVPTGNAASGLDIGGILPDLGGGRSLP